MLTCMTYIKKDTTKDGRGARSYSQGTPVPKNREDKRTCYGPCHRLRIFCEFLCKQLAYLYSYIHVDRQMDR